MEKRQALTSLHTYRPGRVGSVRVPSSNGLVTLPSQGATSRSNAAVFVYEDKGEGAVAGAVAGAEAAPLSIITVARRQEAPKENTLKPGPWTTVPVKKRVIGARTTPGFTGYEIYWPSREKICEPFFVIFSYTFIKQKNVTLMVEKFHCFQFFKCQT